MIYSWRKSIIDCRHYIIRHIAANTHDVYVCGRGEGRERKDKVRETDLSIIVSYTHITTKPDTMDHAHTY